MKLSDCRVCLSSNQTTLPLTIDINTGRKNEKMPIVKIYEFVLKTKIADIENQDSPGSVCLNCMNKLLTSYNFINQAKQSEKTIANKLEVSQILKNLLTSNVNNNQNKSGADSGSSSSHQPNIGLPSITITKLTNNSVEINRLLSDIRENTANTEVPGVSTTTTRLQNGNTSTPQNKTSIGKRKLSKDLTPATTPSSDSQNMSAPVNNEGNDASIVISDDDADNQSLSERIKNNVKCVTCNLKFLTVTEKNRHSRSTFHKKRVEEKKRQRQEIFDQKLRKRVTTVIGTPRKLRKRVNSI